MTADRCWNVAREGHQADCPVGRAEAAERARVERLLADFREAQWEQIANVPEHMRAPEPMGGWEPRS